MTQIDHYDKRSKTTYVYESKSYWDKTKKQPRSHRTLIGKRDPTTKQIIPTDGRRKNPKHHKQQQTPTNTTRKFYGATYLLNQISQKLHITQNLKTHFPQTHNQILSTAYYLTLEDHSPLYRFEKWNHTHKHPHNQNIPSQRASELFANITENQKNMFLTQFAKDNNTKEDHWLHDITTISSYSQTLKQVKWGKNKENDKLPQLNLALTQGQISNLPFYYRKLAGNISDVSTIKQLVADFETLKMIENKPKLVMDRGFYSKANIDLLLKNKYEFLLSVKKSLGFVREALESVYDVITSFEHYDVQYELYSVTVPIEWGFVGGVDRRLFLHLFFDIDRAAEDKKAFDRELVLMRGELLSGKRKAEHVEGYKKYFSVKEIPVEGDSSGGSGVGRFVVVVDEVAVGLAKRFFGFFALLSSESLGAVSALEVYRNRDLVEKAFGDVKDRLSLRRTLVSSEQSLDGKLFVCYVGLIFLSYVKGCMQRAGLFEHYILQGLFDCLDVIECFEYSDGSLRVGEVTEKQKQLYKALGVDPPT